MHTYLGKLLLGLEALCESPSLVNGYTAGSVATLGHTSVSSFCSYIYDIIAISLFTQQTQPEGKCEGCQQYHRQVASWKEPL